jgi:hypothetical protein
MGPEPQAATTIPENDASDLSITVLRLPGWNLSAPGPWKFRPKQDLENQLPFLISSTGVASSDEWILRDIDSRHEEKKNWDIQFQNPNTGETRTLRMHNEIPVKNREGREILLTVYQIEKRAIYLENRRNSMLSPGIVRIGEPILYANILNIVYEGQPRQLEEGVAETLGTELWTYRGLQKENGRFAIFLDNPPKARYKVWIPY